MTTENEVILEDSDEAASQQTVTGWVSRHGWFFGDDERAARNHGATHNKCECGAIIAKPSIKCTACEAEADAEAWRNLPRVAWDGDTPLYSHVKDYWFWNGEDLAAYCEDNDTTPYDLMLVLCVPIYASCLYPEDEYEDSLPIDGGEIPDEIIVAFDKLNNAIKNCKTPLSWNPGEEVPDDASLKNYEGRPVG